MLSEPQVADAAERLVAAFAATDTDSYFAAFSPDASFVFHTEDHRFGDRAAYEAVWQEWLASGWRVEECRSTHQLIQCFGETAVFSHDVRTVTSVGDTRTLTQERETIVFALIGGEVLAVHEHLSPAPADHA